MSADASIARHLLRDRMATEVFAGVIGGDIRSWTMRVRADWRTRTRHDGIVTIVRAGYDVVGEAAPLAFWPGAGSGPGRDVLLRAHRLLDDGVVRNAVFGRRLAHGGAEMRRWFSVREKPVRVGIAGFVDVAQATEGIASSDLRAHMDTGIGARVALPGAGVLRVDLARGLRDGNTAVSIGWTR